MPEETAKNHAATVRHALEHLAAPDMWEQVEGNAVGPDANLTDPLVWRGGDHPSDITRAGLDALTALEAELAEAKRTAALYRREWQAARSGEWSP